MPVAGHGGASALEDAAVDAEQHHHPSGGPLPSLSPQCLREMVATVCVSEPGTRYRVCIKAWQPVLCDPAQLSCSRPQLLLPEALCPGQPSPGPRGPGS